MAQGPLHTESAGSLMTGEGKEVSTSLRPGSISEATAAVTVISGDRVRASGARYISDVLRLVPGIEVIRSSSSESNVSLRGFNDASSAAQGVMVLIDGHQAYNQFYGNAFFDTLPVSLEDIDRIEVIRGPSSFLYGPNAMHGLINIFTKPVGHHYDEQQTDPESRVTDFLSFSTRAGTYDSVVSTLRYGKWDEADKAGIKATVVYDDITQFDPGLGDTRNKRFMTMAYVNQIGEREDHTIGLSGSISHQIFNLLVPQVAIIDTAKFTADMREATVKGDYRLGDVKARASWTGFDARATANRFYAPINVDLDTFDFDLQYSMQLIEDHVLSAGGGINHSIFSTAEPDISFGRHNTTLLSAFVQDEVEIVDDRLFWTMGARFDRHSESGNNISPRAALVWKIEDQHAVRGAYSTGFRNPSHRERIFNLPVTVPTLPVPLTIAGNEGLVAEELRSFELGYSGWFLRGEKAEKDSKTPEERPASKYDEGPPGAFQLDVSVYYNRIDDQVEFPRTATSPIVRPTNVGNEEAYGLEIEVKFLHTDELLSFVNYSWGARRDRETRAHNAIAPRHKGNMGVQYINIEKRFRAMFWVHYFGETTQRAPVDDYVLVNGSVAYDVDKDGKISLYLEAFNLLDDHREQPEADGYGAMVTAGFRVIL